MTRLKLQLALDLVTAEEALHVAGKVAPYVDRIEAGTPLLLAAGMSAVVRLRQLFPKACLVADPKICDAGERIAEAAFAAGADVVTIVAAVADPQTWAGTLRARQAAGGKGRVMADLIGSSDVLAAARQAVDLGADELVVHLPKRLPGEDIKAPLSRVAPIVAAVPVPIYVAGGLEPEHTPLIAAAGVAGLIAGKAITGAADPVAAARAFALP